MEEAAGMSLDAELNAIFTDKLNVRVPTPDTDLIATGLLDSMQIVELVMQIEQQFGVRIGLERVDFDDLRSVSGIARLIAEKAK
jgi:acyl carrier protein